MIVFSTSLMQKLRRMWNRDNDGLTYRQVDFISPLEIIQEYESEIKETGRYVQSSPQSIKNFTLALNAHKEQLDGQVSTSRRQFESELQATEFVNERSKRLGADISGVALLNPSWVYKGNLCTHKYAISLGMKMDPEKMKDVPYSANYESMRVYYELGKVTIDLAKEIRALGYSARAQHPFSVRGVVASQVMHVPIAQDAGLGKLGRHGSLISPVLGSWFRLGTVTTDLPVLPSDPLDDKITSICQACRMCARHCPGQAISYGNMSIANGVRRWVVETEKCVPFWHDLGSCAICIEVCPMNTNASNSSIREEYLKDTRRIRELDFSTYRKLPKYTDGSQRYL